jgi:hypothetical protein
MTEGRIQSAMSHAIDRVRAFAIVGSHTVSVVFDDDTTQTIDFGPMLRGPLFGPLRDLALFMSGGAAESGRRGPRRERRVANLTP